jgi:HSP20 family protein
MNQIGELKRSFYVDDIDDNRIEASFKEGILRVVQYKQSKGTHG